MNQRSADLLIELAKLLRRFGPSEFQTVAQLVSSPEITKTLVTLLEEMARVGADMHQGKPSEKNSQRIDEFFTRLKNSNPEKFELLKEVRARFAEKHLFARVSDILDFATQKNLSVGTCRSREQAVAAILHGLANLPLDELRMIVTELPTRRVEHSDLRGWSEIIMDKRSTKG